jgi:hypothetical protein
MDKIDPVLTVVQYGWPGVFALVLWWLGKMASKFLDAHLENMKKVVDKLDAHSEALAETKTIGEGNSAKLDSLLARARQPTDPGVRGA